MGAEVPTLKMNRHLHLVRQNQGGDDCGRSPLSETAQDERTRTETQPAYTNAMKSTALHSPPVVTLRRLQGASSPSDAASDAIEDRDFRFKYECDCEEDDDDDDDEEAEEDEEDEEGIDAVTPASQKSARSIYVLERQSPATPGALSHSASIRTNKTKSSSSSNSTNRSGSKRLLALGSLLTSMKSSRGRSASSDDAAVAGSARHVTTATAADSEINTLSAHHGHGQRCQSHTSAAPARARVGSSGSITARTANRTSGEDFDFRDNLDRASHTHLLKRDEGGVGVGGGVGCGDRSGTGDMTDRSTRMGLKTSKSVGSNRTSSDRAFMDGAGQGAVNDETLSVGKRTAGRALLTADMFAPVPHGANATSTGVERIMREAASNPTVLLGWMVRALVGALVEVLSKLCYLLHHLCLL